MDGHSFIGHPSVASQLINLGCYLSFSSASLKSKKSMDALSSIPLDRLFLETDSEDGKTRSSISEMYSKVAYLRGLSLNELKKQIYNNYLCLIG